MIKTTSQSVSGLSAGLGAQTVRTLQPAAFNPLAVTSANRKRASAPTTASLERSVVQKINQYRQQQGLSALTTNSSIRQQARRHSQDMATSRAISHDGFDQRVKTIGKTIAWRAAAENVGYNAGYSDPVTQVVNSWLKSPGHLKNIVGNFNLTAVGVAKNSQGEYYFTQIFIQR